MNDLTLWIYIVYVVNRIREVFGGITVAIVIAFAVKVLYFIYIDKDGYVKENEYLNKEEINEFWKNLNKKFWGVLGGFVVFTILLNIVIPNKETMYAMVASETVGHAIDSDIVNKAINSIDKDYKLKESK
jgi:hypothetical protein